MEDAGDAGSGDLAYTVTSWAARCVVETVSHRPFRGLLDRDRSLSGWSPWTWRFQKNRPITEVLGLGGIFGLSRGALEVLG
jgi:hypothetical protein